MQFLLHSARDKCPKKFKVGNKQGDSFRSSTTKETPCPRETGALFQRSLFLVRVGKKETR